MFVIIWRSLFLYTSAIVLMRFMGKRQIGELQPSELVTTVMISNIAAIPIENPDSPLLDGALPVLTIACLEILFSAAALKSGVIRRMLVGKPKRLISNGIIDQKELSELRWSLDDLCAQLRLNGVFDPTEVDTAIAETNGSLSVYQSFNARNVTCADMNLVPGENEKAPCIVISDGEIRLDALRECNLSEEWLSSLLRRKGISNSEVFLLICRSENDYTLIRREEKA